MHELPALPVHAPARARSRPASEALGRRSAPRQQPDTALPITLRRSRYGPYVERGEPGGPHTPTARVSVHPGTGKMILAGMGRYGPWLRHERTYVSIPADDDVLTIGLNRAIALLDAKRGRNGA